MFFFLFTSDRYDLYFSVTKQGFLGNFGTWIFYLKVLSEGYLSELRYACCDVNIKHNDVTVALVYRQFARDPRPKAFSIDFL